MKYSKLIVSAFLKDKITQENLTEDIIIEALEQCYKNCAFSTFPYIMHNMNSSEALHTFNSGNCIALSMYIKNYLKNKYNITGFLIPASIPEKYKFPGFLEISHVVLAIPKNNSKIFIADPAFYFLNPILVDINDKNKSLVFAKEIYSKESSQKLSNYRTIEPIVAKTIIQERTMKFNQYQTIPKNTITSEVYYKDDPNDKWTYYLTEILNPDKSITDFFIEIRNDPFILTTKIDNNGICTSNGYFNLNKNGLVKISELDNDREIYHISQVDKDKLEIARKFTKKFFKSNFNEYINLYKNY